MEGGWRFILFIMHISINFDKLIIVWYMRRVVIEFYRFL